jgi:predicted permease
VILKITPPLSLMRPVSLLGNAALPAMLLILGMQLKRAVAPNRPIVVATAVVLSLLVAPAIGIGLSSLLGLSGAARTAAIILASMPAAVVTTVLALEFDLDSTFVTSVVFVSTLLSPITLVLLIAYLKTS